MDKSSPNEAGLTPGEKARSQLENILHLGKAREEQHLLVIDRLKGMISKLTDDVRNLERDNLSLVKDVERSKGENLELKQRHKKLYEGFLALLSDYESLSSVGVGVDRRIEAALLCSEVASGIGNFPDLSNERSKSFIRKISSDNGVD